MTMKGLTNYTAMTTASSWVEDTALDFVRQSYVGWRRHRLQLSSREPSLSAGSIKGYLDQCGGQHPDYRFTVTKKRYRMVQQALDRLVRAGKLRTSLGLGLRGTEVKVYEPGEVY